MNIGGTQYSLKYRTFNIYLSGCDGICSDECHNKELWDFNIGTPYCLDWKNKIRDKINNFDDMIDKIWIMGGEPLLQDKFDILKLISFLREFNKEIWLWTRFRLEDIDCDIKVCCDYIKTGKYIPELKTEDNIQYGIKLATSNQQIHKRGDDY